MIDNDTLLMYFGNELDERDHNRVAQALEQNPELALRYQQLEADLESLRALPEVTAPQIATARWHRAIQTAAAQEQSLSGSLWQPAKMAAAAAVVLAIGIVIGLRLNTSAGPDTAPVVKLPTSQDSGVTVAQSDQTALPMQTDGAQGSRPQIRQPAFSHGLVDYMQTARKQLVTLAANEDAKRTAVIDEIIAHNRAFERVAESLGENDIARVLRAFDQILQQLALQPSEPSAVDKRIDQLSFEYGAMLTQMQRQASKPYTL